MGTRITILAFLLLELSPFVLFFEIDFVSPPTQGCGDILFSGRIPLVALRVKLLVHSVT